MDEDFCGLGKCQLGLKSIHCEALAQEHTKVLGHLVQREDLSTVEATHAMLRSGVLQEQHLSA